jgi:hypothetical protein
MTAAPAIINFGDFSRISFNTAMSEQLLCTYSRLEIAFFVFKYSRQSLDMQ